MVEVSIAISLTLLLYVTTISPVVKENHCNNFDVVFVQLKPEKNAMLSMQFIGSHCTRNRLPSSIRNKITNDTIF